MSAGLRSLWGMPILLGVLTAVGLVAGLLGEGWWDLAAVIGLAAPVAVGAWYMFKPRKAGQSVPTSRANQQ